MNSHNSHIIKNIRLAACVLSLLFPFLLRSQTIELVTPSYTGLPGNFTIPIKAIQMQNIYAFSLTLNYDTNHITFLTLTYHSALNNYLLFSNAVDGQIRIAGYFPYSPLNLPDSTNLLSLTFDGAPGISNLTWNTQVYGDCMLNDAQGNILPATYTGGTITLVDNSLLPSCAQDIYPADGSPTSTLQLSWHKGGGTITSYQLYFGTSNPPQTLVQNTLDSTWLLPQLTLGTTYYWKVVPYNMIGDAFGCPVWSFLHSADTIITTAGSYMGTPGSIQIPITVKQMKNIGSLSLSVSYDSSVLTFIDLSPHPIFDTSNFLYNCQNGHLNMGYFSLQPVSLLDNESLVTIDFLAFEGICSLSWLTNPAGSCLYTDMNGSSLPSVFQDGNIVVTATGYSVSGSVVYDNLYQTPLPQTEVVLVQNGVPVIQTVTDASGQFVLTGITQGTYTLQFHSTKPTGGFNAVDALQVLKHFTGMSPLSTLGTLAGDVNGSGFINSTDALSIQKRFVEMILTFPAGDWCIPSQTIEVGESSSAPVTVKGLCFGDVNGSFIPLF